MKKSLILCVLVIALLTSFSVAEDDGYKSCLGVDWLTDYETCISVTPGNAVLLADSEEFEEWRITTMENGDVSVTTCAVFNMYEYDFDLTEVFSEEGLYCCNLRTVFDAAEIEAVKGLLQSILTSDGKPDSVLGFDLESCELQDVSALRIEVLWTGTDGTFKVVQIAEFMGNIIFDVNTGLSEYFPMLMERLSA